MPIGQIIIYLLVIAACIGIVRPDILNNIFMMLFKKKEYTVVLFKRSNTDKIETWFVCPKPDKMATIRKGTYNLAEKYSAAKRKGRLYFLVDQKDSVPRKIESELDKKIIDVLIDKDNIPKITFGSYSDDEIVFQAHEMQSALQNRVAELLFGRQKDIIFWVVVCVVCGLAVMMMFVLIWAIAAIQNNNALLTAALDAYQNILR